MKYNECFGKFSGKPCPDYHPSNTPDAIGELMDHYAFQRCWCLREGWPVRDVCGDCDNTSMYDIEIHIKGKLELHLADSLDDVLGYIKRNYQRRGLVFEDVDFKAIPIKEEAAE